MWAVPSFDLQTNKYVDHCVCSNWHTLKYFENKKNTKKKPLTAFEIDNNR